MAACARSITLAFVSAVLLLSGCGSSDAESPATDSTDVSRPAASKQRAPESPPVSSEQGGGQPPGSSPHPPRGEPYESPAAATKLHVDRSNTFYPVTGTTDRALLADMVQKGPHVDGKSRFGRTSWNARWQIGYERPARSSGPCRMSRVDVWVEIEITLPQWDIPSAIPSNLRRDWNAFIDALKYHEGEHEASIIAAGKRILRQTKDLQAASCSALKKKAHERARSIVEESRAYNERYDQRTQHGRRDGANWLPD